MFYYTKDWIVALKFRHEMPELEAKGYFRISEWDYEYLANEKRL